MSREPQPQVTFTDEELGAWRAAYRQTMDPASPSCPSDEDLAGLVLGELEAASRAAVVDHVVSCRRCSDGFRTLKELDRTAAPLGMAATRRRSWRRFALAGLAAGLLSVLAVGLNRTVLAPGAPGPSGDRLRQEEVVEDLVRPADGSLLEHPPGALSWPPLPGASRYAVHLFDAEAVALWESGPLEEAKAELPESVLDMLEPGSYFWVVRPVGGAQLRELGPFWFELAGGAEPR